MSFRLAPKSVNLNDLERRINGRYFASFQWFRVASGAHCVKVHVRYLTSWWVLVSMVVTGSLRVRCEICGWDTFTWFYHSGCIYTSLPCTNGQYKITRRFSYLLTYSSVAGLWNTLTSLCLCRKDLNTAIFKIKVILKLLTAFRVSYRLYLQQ